MILVYDAHKAHLVEEFTGALEPERVIRLDGTEGPAESADAYAYAANIDGPLLITKHDRIPNVTLNYLVSQKDRMVNDHVTGVSNPYYMRNVAVLGGTASVSKGVSSTLNQSLVWTY